MMGTRRIQALCAGLVAVALIAGAACFLHSSKDVTGEKSPARTTIHMAGQSGISAELLEAVGKRMLTLRIPPNASPEMSNLRTFGLDFLQNSDCCAAVTSWGLSADSLQGAVMCPDAAEEFLADNPAFESLGTILYNSDVLVVRADEPLPDSVRVGVAHKRAHQEKMASDAFGHHARILPMLPAALPYALLKGELDAVVMDAGTLRGIMGQEHAATDSISQTEKNTSQKTIPVGAPRFVTVSGARWRIEPPLGAPVPTQMLIVRKTFAHSPAFKAFTAAYSEALGTVAQQYAGFGMIFRPSLEP